MRELRHRNVADNIGVEGPWDGRYVTTVSDCVSKAFMEGYTQFPAYSIIAIGVVGLWLNHQDRTPRRGSGRRKGAQRQRSSGTEGEGSLC